MIRREGLLGPSNLAQNATYPEFDIELPSTCVICRKRLKPDHGYPALGRAGKQAEILGTGLVQGTASSSFYPHFRHPCTRDRIRREMWSGSAQPFELEAPADVEISEIDAQKYQ